MRTTFILTAAAIALVAGIASASEIDPFTTLEGVETRAMTPSEMQGVQGAGFVTADLFIANLTNASVVSNLKAELGFERALVKALNLISQNPSH